MSDGSVIFMENEGPQPCERDCFDDMLAGVTDSLCAKCQAEYDYWCEVDDSEMDIDWSEYADITTSEWVEDDK